MDYESSRALGPSKVGQIIMSCVLWAGQIAIVLGCIVIMAAGLESNGMWYTATLEKTRDEVWLIPSGLALFAVITCLGCFYGLYRSTGRGLWLVWFQVLVIVAVVVMVTGLHGAIPVPPGTHSGQMFAGY